MLLKVDEKRLRWGSLFVRFGRCMLESGRYDVACMHSIASLLCTIYTYFLNRF